MLRVANSRVVDLAADRAYVFARGSFFRVIHLGRYGLGHIVQVNDFLRVQVLITQGRMGGKIDGLIVPDELAHFVQRVPGRFFGLSGHGQLVLVKCLVSIGDITVDEVVYPLSFNYDDTVKG